MRLVDLNINHALRVQFRRSGWRNIDRQIYTEALLTLCRAFPQMRLEKLNVAQLNDWIGSHVAQGVWRAYLRVSVQLLHDYRRAFKSVPARLRLTCPYCSGKASLQDTSSLYGGKSFGLAYVCENQGHGCDSYVGAHQDDHMPVGTLANAPLRHQRHRCFQLVEQIRSANLLGRTEIYSTLAKQLDVTPRECHIGYLDLDFAYRFEQEACLLYQQLLAQSGTRHLTAIEQEKLHDRI